VLLVAPPADINPHLDAFRQGLRALGWVEGQNIALEYRYAEGHYERLPALVAELVHLPVDIIFANSLPVARAAKQATTTIPIVMESTADPVAAGLVENLARPGGNLTGVAGVAPELVRKQLEMLKEVVPSLSRVAALMNPVNPNAPEMASETARVTRLLGVQLQLLEVREPEALADVFAALTDARAEGLLIAPDPMIFSQRDRIVGFATKHRLPLLTSRKEWAEAGSLMAYSVNQSARWQRAAYYVDRILKGRKPADLPIERPMEFEFVINLKTAQALGLTLPPHLLVLATEVIR
jgi:putative ABC transport system substrate-binding protein